MKRFFKQCLTVLLAVFVASAAFGLTVQTVSAVTAPTRVNLAVESGSGYSAVVDIKGKVKVYVSSVYPSSASKSVSWSVYSGGSYGKISSSASTYCYVQGIKAGTVTIKAKSKYYPYVTKYIKVYVKQLYPTGLTLSNTSLNLWTGTSFTLKATVVKKPWVYANPVTWKSNSTGIGTVSSGKVTAVAAGLATITATYTEGTKVFKADCTLRNYHARLTNTATQSLDKGATLTNPVIVTGPGTIPAYTIAYGSNNTGAVAMSTSGVATGAGDGSATITSTVNMPSITSTTKTRALSYKINVRTLQGASFDLPASWARLEIIHEGEGYGGAKSLVLNKGMLDDFFGFGSLGIDLFNPMDVGLNFMGKNIGWNAGGFAFTKTGANVEVSAMKDKAVWYAPYFLYASGTANESIVLQKDSENNVTGYDMIFYHSATNPAAGNATLTLRDNVLTVPFGGETLGFKRIAFNKVQILAALDMDGLVDDPVLTITRTLAGHYFSVEDTGYMTDKGISFYTYKTVI